MVLVTSLEFKAKPKSGDKKWIEQILRHRQVKKHVIEKTCKIKMIKNIRKKLL